MLTNRSLPAATIIPVLLYPDVRAAVDWLGAAFGFAEKVRIGAGHRAQLEVGDGGGVIVAEGGADLRAAPDHQLKIRVSDVDTAFARAREAGARVLSEPTTYPYGERECTIEDPAGHRWQLTQTVADTAPEDWGGTTVG